MNVRTLKRRLDRVTGADRPPPRGVLWLPPNSRDLMVHDPHDVVRLSDPVRATTARREGLSDRESFAAARLTDDEVEAIGDADPTVGAHAGVSERGQTA
jgi:hypothetical protein